MQADTVWNHVQETVGREEWPNSNKRADLGQGGEVFGVQEDECTALCAIEFGRGGGNVGRPWNSERDA